MSPDFPSSIMIGERLALARKTRELDRNALAELAEIPAYQVARIERGDLEKLPFPDIGKLCGVLGISLDALVAGDGQAIISSLASTTSNLPTLADAEPDDLAAQLRDRLVQAHGDEFATDAGTWLDQGMNGLILGPPKHTRELFEDMIGGLGGEVPTLACLFESMEFGGHIRQIHPTDKRIAELTRQCAAHRPRRLIIELISEAELIGWLHLLGEGFSGSWATVDAKKIANLWETLQLHESAEQRPAADGLHMMVECGQNGQVCQAAQLLRDTRGILVPYPLYSCNEQGALKRERFALGETSGGSPSPAAPAMPLVVADPLDPPPGVIPFGEINVGTNKQRVIGMPTVGLNTHMYMCGTTGSGKSTLLQWIAYGLVKDGKSIFLVDPQGELADQVLEQILAFVPERADDVVVLDFGDTDHPISFNPLAIDSASDLEPITNAMKEMIVKLLNLNPDSTPRAVNYMEQAVWAMAECNLRALGGHKHRALTLLQVADFFTNREFRQLVMQFCTNLSIRSTFDPDGVFEKLGEQQQLNHVMPVLRIFSNLTTKDSFGNIFGQSENHVDFAKLVREQKIVLMKLPVIDSDASAATFIGSMITPMLINSLSKWGHNVDLSAYMIIDEFQNYATESYNTLLAGARKFGLYGISANQVPQDLAPDILRKVQSNTQTKISMRLDAFAVKEIADFIASGEDHPQAKDILALPNYWGWANVMMSGGKPSGPFVFKTLAAPLDSGNPLFADRYDEAHAQYERSLPKVIERCRDNYSQPQATVEKMRYEHLRAVSALLEEKIKERMRAGGYEGTFDPPAEEDFLDDLHQWG